MDKKNILTYEGLKKLEDELQNLKVVKRKEVAQKIKEAREQGDLSENAEYDAAKDEQRDIEARIEEIEKILKNAEVVVEEEVDALSGQYGAQGLAVNVAFQVGGEDAAGHMIAGLQLLGQGVQPVFPAGRQDEPEAQPRVPAGELLPDAGRSAGDPDCFLVHRTCPFSEARSCVDGAQLVGGEGGVVQRLEVV